MESKMVQPELSESKGHAADLWAISGSKNLHVAG